ncbi:MAG: preprotein translocase subunit YajC [Bacteroidetes bacterium]|nr:MAG: preprotein translocase subunit YajC [Bacteroidota bacterium]
MLFLAATNTTAQLLFNLLFFGGVILIVFLFMILPQRRKQRELKDFHSSLKEGTMVVTIGGLHGKIHALTDETVILIADKHTKLMFDKYAISPEATRRLHKRLEKEGITQE